MPADPNSSRAIRRQLTLALLLCTALPWPGSAQPCERYSDNFAEISVRIPLIPEPPGGKQFFAFSPPRLAPYDQARAYELVDGALLSVFCATPPGPTDTAVVEVGPARVRIPGGAFKRQQTPGARTQLIGVSPAPVEINWVAPTSATITTDAARQATIAVDFAVPPPLKVEIGSVKVSFVRSELVCRAASTAKSLTIPVTVEGALGANSTVAHPATFQVPVHCGPPATLEVDLGPFRQTTAPLQSLSVVLKKRISVDPQVLKSFIDGCPPYLSGFGNESACVWLRANSRGGEITAPAWSAVFVRLPDSNVFPQEVRVSPSK